MERNLLDVWYTLISSETAEREMNISTRIRLWLSYLTLSILILFTKTRQSSQESLSLSSSVAANTTDEFPSIPDEIDCNVTDAHGRVIDLSL